MGDQFRAALGALFGPDPVQQQAANTWLNEFAKTPEAWASALALLEPSSGATLEQAFFAANLLASKTRNEWSLLSPQQRSELADTYLAKLRGLLLSGPPAAAAAVPAVLMDRVSLLAASAAALGGTAAAERHLGCAQEVAAAARAAMGAEQSRAGGEALLRSSLLMLQHLAEEAEGLDRVRRTVLVSGSTGSKAATGTSSSDRPTGLLGWRAGVLALVREVLSSAAGGAGPAGAGGGTGREGGGPSFPLLLAAVRCLWAWVRLHESGSLGCGVSPAELEALSPGLTQLLLGLLALPSPGPPTCSPLSAAANVRQQQQAAVVLYQADADLLADLLGPGGRTCTRAAGGESADAAATAAFVAALVPLGRQLAAAAEGEAAAEAAAGAAGGGGAALAALVAGLRVAVAVAERNAGGVATGPGEGAVELAGMVVAAMAACPSRREVVEVAADFFLSLNTVPTAERHPALGPPLYGVLLPYVVRAVSYPPGFTDWDAEVEEDEEAFHRFREQQAADLLESMYGQCRTSLVAHLVSAATSASSPAPGGDAGDGSSGARGDGGGPPGSGVGGGGGGGSDWRTVEAALFCLRAVHMQVKAAALGGRAGELDNPAAAATAAEVQALLGRLFNDVCSPTGRMAGLLAVPWVALSVSRLAAEYAAWLGRSPEALLQGVLGLMLGAVKVPVAAPAAAQAFRNLCVRGSEPLTSHSPTLAALASAAMAVVAPPPAPPPPASPSTPLSASASNAASADTFAVPIGLEERCVVVEGLARLVAKLPADAAAEAGATLLMGPCVVRAQAIAAAAAATGGPLSPATLSALASELGLMTAVVRFLEFPSLAAHSGPHHSPSPPGAGASAGSEHPALRVLQVAWPVLSAVAGEPQCRRDPGVADALAELYKRSLLATKLSGRPLLPPLIASLLAVLGERPAGSVLDCLATVVEVFGEAAHSGEAREAQITAFQGAVQMMSSLMAHLQQQPTSSSFPPSASSPGELAASFFTLADRFLVFARELVLGEPRMAGAVPVLVEWAGSVLVLMREREPAAAALAFLQHLLSAAARVTGEAAAGGAGGAGADAATTAATQELRARLDSQLASCGPRLVQCLMVAGADTCPRQLMRPLAGALGGLTALADAGAGAGGPTAPTPPGGGESAVRTGLPGWLRGAWGQPSLAELIQSGRLGEGGAHAVRFTELLLRGHYPPAVVQAPGGATAALPRGRLDSLVTDFFAVARGEATEDVLLAYEL